MFTCLNCNKVYESEVNFCSVCGASIKKVKKHKNTLDSIISFYVLTIVFIVISYFVYNSYPEDFGVDLLLEGLFIVLVLGFAITDYKNIIKLYKISKLDKWLLLFIPLTFANAFFIYFGTNYINNLTGFELDNYYSNYLYIENTLVWATVFIAILPPIFEELAFRGYLFNLLSKISSVKSTIIVTSFLFALIHFSAVSILWIFPFGLFLGYLRHKYNSLLLPMLIHFIHNFTILMIDYYLYLNQ